MIRLIATLMAMVVLAACTAEDPSPGVEWKTAFHEVETATRSLGGATALLTPLSGATLHVSEPTSPLFGMSFQAGGTRQRWGAGEFAVLVVKPFSDEVTLLPEGMMLAGNPVEIQVLQLPSKQALAEYLVKVAFPFAEQVDDDPVLWSAFYLRNKFINLFDQRDHWFEQHTTPLPGERTVSFENGPGIYAAAVKDRDVFCAEDWQINCFPETMPAEFTTNRNVPLLNYAVPATDADGKLMAAALRPPAHGELILLSSGIFTYTPDTDYVGADDFTFFVTDGLSDPVTGAVRIRVE